MEPGVHPVPWEETPSTMGAPEVREFLTHLARDRKVAASTQNQALNGLVFLYDAVLKERLGEIGAIERARRPVRLPAVTGTGI